MRRVACGPRRLLAFLAALLLAGATERAAGGATEPSGEAKALVAQARARKLSGQPYWSALLHYRRGFSGKVASEIVSPDFFLAPTGATDPEAELEATLAALFEPAGDDPDGHAQCRFVARYRWLRKSLDWSGARPPVVPCRQFDAYTLGNQIESLSLVYATGFLSNPASAYGHILLKFNTRRSVASTDLLDRSLNFGAIVPANENGAIYVFRGLFGGYDAAFSSQRFYHFNHEYAENELRDLWEYVLALNEDEVEQIVAHSWELLGKKYVYYFLKENCGYRMAELLELVLEKPLLPDLPYALPGTVFERIMAVERDGVPLVRDVRRIPSRQNRFRERYLAMGATSQAVARELATDKPGFGGAPYRALPETGKVEVVDTLLDYFQYRIISDKQDVEAKRAKQALLIERTSLPAEERSADARTVGPADVAPPHEGPLPLLVRTGVVHNGRLGNGLALRIRPANYDQLALDAGRIPNSSLAMFDLRLVHLDGGWKLRSLDVFEVENLNVAKTPLPGDGGPAWKLRIGLRAQDLECDDCTRLRGEAGVGKAVSLGARVVGFAMVDVFAESHRAERGDVGAVPRLGLIASLTPAWKSYVSVGRQVYWNGPREHQRLTRWENRIGSDRRWDVRLSFEENVAREFAASLSLYW